MYRIIVLLSILCFHNIEGRFFRNDYEFHNSLEGWTKLHPMPAKWGEARLRCYYEGAILLSPINQELLAEMKKVITDTSLPVFTGFSSTHFNGDYYSVEGVSLEQISPKWAPGEPNNSGNEQCIAMFSNGTLKDVSCDQPLPYICYKQNSEDMASVNACGTVDQEYQFDSRTGHCYKVHRFTQTWSRGFLACSAEGGYLAIINTEQEAQVLRELMAKYPSAKIQGKERDIFGIGFRDWSDHGVFMTVHGETLKEAGYELWSGGQPDNQTTHCGVVFRDAKLDDFWCNVPIPFICEKLPGSLLDNETGRADEINPKLQG